MVPERHISGISVFFEALVPARKKFLRNGCCKGSFPVLVRRTSGRTGAHFRLLTSAVTFALSAYEKHFQRFFRGE